MQLLAGLISDTAGAVRAADYATKHGRAHIPGLSDPDPVDDGAGDGQHHDLHEAA